jgi:hypothetical protein
MTMSDNPIARLKELIRRVGHLDAPSVGLLRPEIRSGDKFLLRDPFKGKAGSGAAGKKAEKRLQKGAVGAIVMEWGYDVPAADVPAFMSFLAANEETLLATQPNGVRYKGTYAVFSSTEKSAGQFRTVWAYKEFGDLDTLSDEYEDMSLFATLVRQLRGFADNSPGAGRSQQIYLLAASSRVTDA